MIEIKTIEKSGFSPQFSFECWKTAFITHSKEYDELKLLKKHLLTDEVFTLIRGKATIFTVENNKIVKTRMKKGKTYNVTKSTYHHVRVSKNGLLFVVENSNTNKDNTESKLLSEKELKETIK